MRVISSSVLMVNNYLADYSKTSIKRAPKYQIVWENNLKITQIVRKASNLCHKFDAFLTISAIFSIISSINFTFRDTFYLYFTVLCDDLLLLVLCLNSVLTAAFLGGNWKAFNWGNWKLVKIIFILYIKANQTSPRIVHVDLNSLVKHIIL